MTFFSKRDVSSYKNIKTKFSSLNIFAYFLLAMTTAANAVQSEKAFTVAKRFNLHGQVTGIIHPDPDGSGPLKHLATRNSYNSQGQLVQVEEGELHYWNSDNYEPQNWYGFHPAIKQVFTYNSRGLKDSIAKQNANGITQTFTQLNYDQYDRLQCEVARMDPANFDSLVTDACQANNSSLYGYDRVTKYTYDSVGQILVTYKAYDTPLQQAYRTNTYYQSKIGLVKTIKDANNNTTTLEYDADANLKYRRYPDASFEHYTYDSNGNIKTETKRNGAVFTYTYDDNNRVIRKSSTSGQYFTYTYDTRGLTTITTSGSYGDTKWITNNFDGVGNLLSTTTAEGYYPTINVRTLEYQYDLNNNRTRITHPDNSYFTYEFDGINRISSLSNQNNENLLSLAYNKNGRRDNITRANNNGASTEYVYDDILRLNQFTQDFALSGSDLSNSFTYNPANQVTSIDYSNSVYQYQGNENKSGNYSVNNLNQYTVINGESLSYDNNGNLTSENGTNYSYDDENRLITVSGNKSASFIYDPLGRLYQSTINGITTQYLYDGDALIAEYNSSGSLTKRYVHGDQVDEPWVEFDDTNTARISATFLHADHQGSIIAQSNVTGTISHTLAYDAYGIADDGNNSRFAYTGQIEFTELGLYYYKARIYHPKLGRFLQTDPIGYEDQMNLYAYVYNDPINNDDPSGKCGPLTPVCYGLAVIGAAALGYDILSDSKEGLDGMADQMEKSQAKTNKMFEDIQKTMNGEISGTEMADSMVGAVEGQQEMANSVIEDGGKIVSSIPGSTMTGTVPTSASDLAGAGAVEVIKQVSEVTSSCNTSDKCN